MEIKMKKIIIFYIICVVLIACVNPLFYYYNYFTYSYNEDVKPYIEENIKYYEENKDKLGIRSMPDYMKELINMMLSVDYILVSKNEAFIMLWFSDECDNNAFYCPMPYLYHNEQKDKIRNVQFFEKDGQYYMECEYEKSGAPAYSLFKCENFDSLKQMLDEKDLFTGGTFNSVKKTLRYFASESTLRNFIPVGIMSLVLFLPCFTEEKCSTDEVRKIARIMAKIGFVAVPAALVFIFLKTYIF